MIFDERINLNDETAVTPKVVNICTSTNQTASGVNFYFFTLEKHSSSTVYIAEDDNLMKPTLL